MTAAKEPKTGDRGDALQDEGGRSLPSEAVEAVERYCITAGCYTRGRFDRGCCPACEAQRARITPGRRRFESARSWSRLPQRWRR